MLRKQVRVGRTVVTMVFDTVTQCWWSDQQQIPTAAERISARLRGEGTYKAGMLRAGSEPEKRAPIAKPGTYHRRLHMYKPRVRRR